MTAKIPILELEFDDRVLRLAFDLNALITLEEYSGIDILNMGEDLEMNISLVRTMIWAGSLREEPQISLKEVGALLHPGNLASISTQVGAFFAEAFPQAEDGDEGNTEAASA